MVKFITKPAIRSGVLLVALSWINFFVTRGADPTLGQIGSIAVLLVMIPFMIQAMKSDRAVAESHLTFWGAFFAGARVVVVSALCMFVSTLIFMGVNYNGFKQWSAGPNDLDQSTNVPIMNTFEQGFIMFLVVLFFGTIFSIVISIFIKKTK